MGRLCPSPERRILVFPAAGGERLAHLRGSSIGNGQRGLLVEGSRSRSAMVESRNACSTCKSASSRRRCRGQRCVPCASSPSGQVLIRWSGSTAYHIVDGERLRRSEQTNAAMQAALRMNQPGARQSLQHFGEVGQRDTGRIGDLLGRLRLFGPAGEMGDGPQGIFGGLRNQRRLLTTLL